MNKLTTGWFPGLPYGLGLMPLSFFDPKGGDPDNKTALVGHGGEDWGSGSNLAGD